MWQQVVSAIGLPLITFLLVIGIAAVGLAVGHRLVQRFLPATAEHRTVKEQRGAWEQSVLEDLNILKTDMAVLDERLNQMPTLQDLESTAKENRHKVDGHMQAILAHLSSMELTLAEMRGRQRGAA